MIPFEIQVGLNIVSAVFFHGKVSFKNLHIPPFSSDFQCYQRKWSWQVTTGERQKVKEAPKSDGYLTFYNLDHLSEPARPPSLTHTRAEQSQPFYRFEPLEATIMRVESS